jgi:3-phenylpropionate/cinnamic acid dioxygenase small subunit
MPEALELQGPAALRAEVEAFLFREAELLDSGDLDAWLALFAQDATYWVPSGGDDVDPMRRVSIVYDRLPQLRERVWRLRSGVAHAQEPPSRTVHLVSNVVAEADEDRIHARSAFIVAEFRRGRRHVHAGRYRHELRRTDAGFAIVAKKAELVDNDGYLGNLSILL